MERYNPRKIEERWQKKWEKEKTFKVDISASKKPFYNLMMFPYPSGEGLHVGHVYAFGGSDTFGRFMSMRGFDVFEPMGFDSFGIHSENYAIKIGKHPRQLIDDTTTYFREKQMKRLGALFDWSHQVITSESNYYKWTQWIFLQLFKAGLAERKKAPVDWCPSCKTVLADEQVIAGKCERCEAQVVQKELLQWFFKITKYSEKLLKNLDWIDWSETTKSMQRNWIGRSEGTEINFPVQGRALQIKVFTTRPDTIFGATFMVLAPENDLALKIVSANNKAKVEAYVQESKNKTEIERTQKSKEGIFTGSYCINPVTKKPIPIFVANYVLMGYGTGAIMGVPAHDSRDWDFAKGHKLEVIEVISGGNIQKEAYVGEGKLVNSGKFNGLDSVEGIRKISDYIQSNKIGKKKTNYHLRDWLISRQRYWGPPIPIIYCDNCGTVPVPEKDLPVELPYLKNFKPTGTGKAPLAQDESFIKVVCPQCGKSARRETDVSDTFLDSSWYFLRYPSAGLDELKNAGPALLPWDPRVTKKWLPVDMYIGGNEHAVLHLMYTRFITMALHDLGFINFEEPFKKFRAHGLVIHGGEKMSKSRGNVVSPNEYIDAYGADTLRMYLLFLGPYDRGGDFSDRAIAGMHRFLNRVWNLCTKVIEKNSKSSDSQLLKTLHKTTKKVEEDIENLKFNTAIASLMEFLNEMVSKEEKLNLALVKHFLHLLAPFAPHLTEELWEKTGEKDSIHKEGWPSYEKKFLEEGRVTIVIQINGKLRDTLEAHRDIKKEEAVRLAVDQAKIKSYTLNKTIKKIVWVEGKLLNLVI